MNQVLIVLRGAPASGKTTIGENLRNFDKKIVWFKTDNIKPFFSEYSEASLDAAMQTCLAALKYLLDQGYSVIYEGIFKNPMYANEAIQMGKSKNIQTVAYQLHCLLKTLQERDRTRKGIKEGCRKPLGDELIGGLFQAVENNPIEDSVILDTENQSLEDCLSVIRKNFN